MSTSRKTAPKPSASSTGFIRRLMCCLTTTTSKNAPALLPADDKETPATKLIDVDGFKLPLCRSIDDSFIRGPALGRGSFANVYLATWQGMPVAVKELYEFDIEYVRTFRYESAKMQILTQEGVSCIPRFRGYKENVTTRTYQILMEYIPGKTVFDLAEPYYKPDAKTRIPTLLAATIMSEITLACDELIAHNLVHSDLKTENLIWTPSGKIKLLDIAFAARTNARGLHHGATKRGTPRYVAPEIMMYQHYSEKSEVFALGTVAHILANQGTPLPDLSEREIPVDFSTKITLSAQCDPTLAALITQSWQTKPANRPTMASLHASYSELRDRLASLHRNVPEVEESKSASVSLTSSVGNQPFYDAILAINTSGSDSPLTDVSTTKPAL